MTSRVLSLALAVSLAAAVAVQACGEPVVASRAGGGADAGSGSTGGSDAGGGVDAGVAEDTGPSLHITSPATGKTWDLPADAHASFPVGFEVKNVALKNPDACGGAAGCGHVRVRIDGDACNAEGLDHNGLAIASPARAAFRLCPDTNGKKTISLELVDDAGQPITDSAGKPVADSIDVTLRQNTTDPTIAITDPTGDHVLDIVGTESYPVTTAVERFTLKDVGSCAGAAACGHVHLFIDGDACDSDGSFNNEGTSPLDALFSLCASPVGLHTVSVELHDDAHAPVKDQYGNVVSASVDVSTREER